MTTSPVSITLFGQTRTVECYVRPDVVDSVRLVAVGRFPTGKKLHASSLRLWKREQPNGRLLHGSTAAIIDGVEYVADTTLYIHNSNRGRLVAWNDDLADSGWRGY